MKKDSMTTCLSVITLLLLGVMVGITSTAFGADFFAATYGGSDYEYAIIQQTADGGYIMGGQTDSFGAGDGDFWILKLDNAGNVTWQKTYGGPNSENGFSIQQTADSGYIVAGRTESFGGSSVYSPDLWILKLDSAGSVT